MLGDVLHRHEPIVDLLREAQHLCPSLYRPPTDHYRPHIQAIPDLSTIKMVGDYSSLALRQMLYELKQILSGAGKGDGLRVRAGRTNGAAPLASCPRQER